MEKGVIKLSLEDAKKLYEQGGNFRTIALSAYSEEELKEPELPNTWEGFCSSRRRKGYYITSGSTIEKTDTEKMNYILDKNLLPSKEMAEAMLALCQLIKLRDCYNQGWKPNWCDGHQNKFIIYFINNKLECDTAWTCSHVMVFKSSILRDKFYKNFRDLLETAKELL